MNFCYTNHVIEIINKAISMITPYEIEEFDRLNATKLGFALCKAAETSDLEKVAYILTHYTTMNTSQYYINETFGWACHGGSLEIIDFLLNSEEIVIRPQLSYTNYSKSSFLEMACFYGHLPVVKELVHHIELHPSQHAYQSIKNLCENKYLSILEFLLLEQPKDYLPNTIELDIILHTYPEAYQLLQRRELNELLQVELSLHSNKKTKLKV